MKVKSNTSCCHEFRTHFFFKSGYLNNKQTEQTSVIVVYRRVLGFDVHCMRPARYQRAIHSLFAFETDCEFAVTSNIFHNPDLIFYYYYLYAFTVRRV